MCSYTLKVTAVTIKTKHYFRKKIICYNASAENQFVIIFIYEKEMRSEIHRQSDGYKYVAKANYCYVCSTMDFSLEQYGMFRNERKDSNKMSRELLYTSDDSGRVEKTKQKKFLASA